MRSRPNMKKGFNIIGCGRPFKRVRWCLKKHYDIDITHEWYVGLNYALRGGGCSNMIKCYEEGKPYREDTEIWVVEVKGKKLPFVFNKKHGLVMMMLPKKCFDTIVGIVRWDGNVPKTARFADLGV